MMKDDQMVAMEVVNRMCMEYFFEVIKEEGIDLDEMKPELPMIKEMKNYYFIDGYKHSLTKDFFSGRSVIFDKKLPLDEKPIQEYLDKDFKDSIKEVAIIFVNEIKKHENSDIIFSTPHCDMRSNLSVFTNDPKTGFSARLIHGFDLFEVSWKLYK